MPKVRIGAGQVALLHMDATVARAPAYMAPVMRTARRHLAAVHEEPTAAERDAWGLLTAHDQAAATEAAKQSVPGGIEVTWTEGVATGAPVSVGWRTWRQ